MKFLKTTYCELDSFIAFYDAFVSLPFTFETHVNDRCLLLTLLTFRRHVPVRRTVRENGMQKYAKMLFGGNRAGAETGGLREF